MQQITTASGLREAIILLESKRKTEEAELREQLHHTYESIKPVNLIKSVYVDVLESPDLRDSLLSTSLGLGIGYVSKAVFVGASHSPLRKLFGTILLYGVTTAVRNNPEAVKAIVKKTFIVVKNMISDRPINKVNS